MNSSQPTHPNSESNERNSTLAGPTEAEFRDQIDDPDPGWLREFVWFLRDNKRWWMLPILIVLALLTTIAVLAGTGAAPFIYALF